MTCSQCQTALPTNAAFCTRCGTPVARMATAAQAPPQPGPGWGSPGQATPAGASAAATPATAGASFRFDLRRLTTADRTIGIASLLTFIALFLPWFGVSVEGVSFSESGMSAHGYLAIVLILAVAIVAYLVLRAGWDRLPMRLPVAHAPLLLIATGLQLIIVLLAFLFKPAGLSWDFGAYLGLITAVVACAPIAVPAMRSLSEGQR